jgi:hypothetical protein
MKWIITVEVGIKLGIITFILGCCFIGMLTTSMIAATPYVVAAWYSLDFVAKILRDYPTEFNKDRTRNANTN